MKTVERNKAIICRFNKEFIERGNDIVFDEIVDADFIYHAYPHGTPEGREAFYHFYQKALRPRISDLRVDIVDIVAEGDKVVTMKAYSGIVKPEMLGDIEQTVEIDIMEIARLKDGKIVELWNVMDSQNILLQNLSEENSIY